jgi:hypothetical protein
MAGAVIDIVAYGAQSLILTGNPDFTFMKKRFKQHTNFAKEALEITPQGSVGFNRRLIFNISRSGDVVSAMFVKFDMPALSSTGTVAWTRHVGTSMIKYTEVQIGGQRIEKQYGQFMHIWAEVSHSAAQYPTYNNMIGNSTDMTVEAASIPAKSIHVPLNHWFNKDVGLGLPLIALQYHEVKIEMELRPVNELYVSSAGTVTAGTLDNVSLWADYYFLDTDERRKMAQIPHEYLIDELQFTGEDSSSATATSRKLDLNHPVKALYFVAQLASNVDAGANRHTDFTTGTTPYNGASPLTNAKLLFNGNDRIQERVSEFFNQLQPYQHHTRGPAEGIYMYAWALHPEDHQPSGNVNFSRIDNATLRLTMATSSTLSVYIYAINTNVGRILSGMFGKAYAS